MADIIPILRASLKDLWDDLFTTAACNLLWLLSVVLVIPGPPATIAIFYYGNRRARGEVADISDFWSALRRYWKPAWRWGIVNLAVVAVLVCDYMLTGRLSQSSFARFMQSFYLAALWAWILLQFFALPFLIEQETPSVRLALRNGAVMMGRNLEFTLALGVLLTLTLLAGTVLFMLSVAAGSVLVAVAGNRAVLNRLEAQRATG